MSASDDEKDSEFAMAALCVICLAAVFAPSGWHLTVFFGLFLLMPSRRTRVRHD